MLCGILVFLLCQGLHAQGWLRGVVLDENKVPVPYASVALLSAQVGASTGDDGRFTLLLPSSDPVADTLIVQCLGFQRYGRVQVFVAGTQLTITLHSKPIDLHEVEVAAAQELPDPLRLLKDARKNVRKLYLRDKVQLPGYYREVRSVNGVYKEMNDALLQLDYTGYPQRKYSRRSFHDYWDAFFAFSRYSPHGRCSSFAQFWPAFVDPEDHVDMVTTRASAVESEQARYGDPLGGPVDLVAMDFVKYELHFLYPKLQKEYVFKTKGRTIDDGGRRCYVVTFEPVSGLECYHHDWRKKIETPFYKGQLTITVDSHVITGFDMESVDLSARTDMCQHLSANDQQWYAVKSISGSVRYDSTAQGWVLSRVDQVAHDLLPVYHLTAERIWKRVDSLPDESVVWQRSLRLGPPNQTRVATDPGSAFPILHETMRSRYNAYDSAAWVHAAASYPYVPPPPEVTRDLERDVPLNVQFRLRDTPIERLEQPAVEAFPCMAAIDLSDSSTQCLINYQDAENDYANLVLQRMVDYERRFSNKAAQVVQWNDVEATPDTSLGAFISSGKDNTLRLCDRRSDGTVDTLLNMSAEIMKRNGERLNDYDVHPSFFTCSFMQPAGGVSTVLIWDRHTGQLRDSLSQVVFYSFVNDSSIFYTTGDEQGRASHALTHVVFSPISLDRMIKTCEDPRFDMVCTKSTSRKYVVIRTVSKNEERLELFRNVDQKLLPVFPDGRYTFMSADHYANNTLLVATQSGDGNSEVRSLIGPTGDTGKVVYSTKKQILDLHAVGQVLMVLEYDDFNEDLVLVDLTGKRSTKEIHQGSGPQTITLEYDGPVGSKVIYEAPGIPPETFTLDTLNFSLNSVKKDELTWWATQGNIVTEVLMAPTADGVEVPILVSYDKNAIKDSVTAILAHVYGAYGATPQADFDNADYALMREGFVVAHAGVRGTGVLGRAWYDAGKGLQKQHSFDDFATALTFLETRFKVPAGRVFAKGISAGGLVVGNILNTHPELLGGAIMDRPFLNIYGAMMDSSRYLTGIEFEEWGDPHNAEVGKLMRSYSPLQNIRERAYPPLFLRGSELDRLTPADEILEAAYAYRKQADDKPLILCAIRPGQGHIVQYRAKDAAEEFAFMKYVIGRGAGDDRKWK